MAVVLLTLLSRFLMLSFSSIALTFDNVDKSYVLNNKLTYTVFVLLLIENDFKELLLEKWSLSLCNQQMRQLALYSKNLHLYISEIIFTVVGQQLNFYHLKIANDHTWPGESSLLYLLTENYTAITSKKRKVIFGKSRSCKDHCHQLWRRVKCLL